MKQVIAHLKHDYLPISETFIYQYITNIQRYKIIFLTQNIQNLELFPFQYLLCAPKFRRYSLQWMYDKICQRLLKREIYYEFIIRKEEAKIIHAHFGPNGVQMLNTKKRLGLPLITTFYGYDMSRFVQAITYKNRFTSKLKREASRFGLNIRDTRDYTNYSAWIREEPARSFFKKILFSEKALFPIYVDKLKIQAQFENHMARNAEFHNELCLALTFELWLRQVFEKEFRN